MPTVEEYLLVDGYNIIFAWDELKAMAGNISLEAARNRLLEILSNYQGLKQNHIIVVFDAYNVTGGVEKTESYYNITVVYTAELETADNYIERTAGRLTQRHRVWVATSDSLEQIMILGRGAYRLSASMLLSEVKAAEVNMRKTITQDKPIKKNSLMSNLDKKTIELLEKMRRNM